MELENNFPGSLFILGRKVQGYQWDAAINEPFVVLGEDPNHIHIYQSFILEQLELIEGVVDAEEPCSISEIWNITSTAKTPIPDCPYKPEELLMLYAVIVGPEGALNEQYEIRSELGFSGEDYVSLKVQP